jgi:HAD superfamily hydrolase (TIGR01509 family)
MGVVMGGGAVDLVIFDCDGVLVDSERLAAQVMAELVTAQGYPLTADDCLARFTGIAMTDVLAAIEADLGRPLPADFAATIRTADFAAFARSLRPVAGVAELLAAFPYRCCVASSGTPEKIRYTLGLTGLLARLEPHLFSARMVRRGKPAPDLFLHAAATMGADPARCVVIEDARAGILAARAAGMRAFGFAGASHCGDGYGAMLAAAGADRVFSRMAALPAMLAEA